MTLIDELVTVFTNDIYFVSKNLDEKHFVYKLTTSSMILPENDALKPRFIIDHLAHISDDNLEDDGWSPVACFGYIKNYMLCGTFLFRKPKGEK